MRQVAIADDKYINKVRLILKILEIQTIMALLALKNIKKINSEEKERTLKKHNADHKHSIIVFFVVASLVLLINMHITYLYLPKK